MALMRQWKNNRIKKKDKDKTSLKTDNSIIIDKGYKLTMQNDSSVSF